MVLPKLLVEVQTVANPPEECGGMEGAVRDSTFSRSCRSRRWRPGTARLAGRRHRGARNGYSMPKHRISDRATASSRRRMQIVLTGPAASMRSVAQAFSTISTRRGL